jgi:hypothetical protein
MSSLHSMPSLPTFSVRPFETPCRIDQQQQNQQHERHDAKLMCTIILEFKFMESRPTAPQWLMLHSVGSADFLCHVHNFCLKWISGEENPHSDSLGLLEINREFRQLMTDEQVHLQVHQVSKLPVLNQNFRLLTVP